MKQYYSQGNVYIEEHSLVYFFVPKSACTTIKRTLADLIDVPPEGNVHYGVDFDFIKKENWSISSSELISFTVVREPLSRIYSCFKNKIKPKDFLHKRFTGGVANILLKYDCFYGGMSFDSFVDAVSTIPDSESDPHFKSQTSILQYDGTILPEHILKFETLSTDWKDFCRKNDIPHRPLPHLMGSEKQSITVSKRCATKVYERYLSDYSNFGFNRALGDEIKIG